MADGETANTTQAAGGAQMRQVGEAFADLYGETVGGFVDRLRARGQQNLPGQEFAAREIARLEAEAIRNELEPNKPGIRTDAIRTVVAQ